MTTGIMIVVFNPHFINQKELHDRLQAMAKLHPNIDITAITHRKDEESPLYIETWGDPRNIPDQINFGADRGKEVEKDK